MQYTSSSLHTIFFAVLPTLGGHFLVKARRTTKKQHNQSAKMKELALLLLWCTCVVSFHTNRCILRMSSDPVDPLDLVRSRVDKKTSIPPKVVPPRPGAKKAKLDRIPDVNSCLVAPVVGAVVEYEQGEVDALVSTLPVALYLEFRSLCEKLAIASGVLCLGLYLGLIIPLVKLFSHTAVAFSPSIALGLCPLAFSIPIFMLWQWENGKGPETINNFMLAFLRYKKKQVLQDESEISSKEQLLAKAAFAQLFNSKDENDLASDMRKLKSVLKGIRMPEERNTKSDV